MSQRRQEGSTSEGRGSSARVVREQRESMGEGYVLSERQISADSAGISGN